MSDKVISIVLGSLNRRRFLKATIESIRNNGISVPYEVIVVEGGSTDGSIKWLANQKDIITIVQHNRGSFRGKPIERQSWGYFMNLAFKSAQGKYVLMASDDCLLVPGSVMNGLNHFESLREQGRNVAAVAFYWRNWPEQKDYRVGLTLGHKMFVNHGMFLREAVQEVGWIEEDKYFFYHADGDLCLKLWNAGYEVVDCPTAFVEHFPHTFRSVTSHKDWHAYTETWRNVFSHDEDASLEYWITLSHFDSHNTARNFPTRDVLAHKLEKAYRRAGSRLKQKTLRCVRAFRS